MLNSVFSRMKLMEILNSSSLLLFMLLQSVRCGERDRWHPKYPPVIWFPEFPMFNNRTNPARIVVQMHDSLDFFCPDYINSQYQSFTGSKKHATSSDFYGAEEIYMVDGQDYQSCFSDLAGGRLAKKHVRLLLRCPGKTADARVKAKYQYTVSFRMFSPVPKGPEFNCNQEYYFLGIFPGHKHDEEAVEKALCSSQALRLQIFVSCSDIPIRHMFDSFPSPNVIQLDRPAQPSDLSETTSLPPKLPTSSPQSVQITSTIDQIRQLDPVLFQRKPNTKTSARPQQNSGLYIASSDRKIMRGNQQRGSNENRRRQQQPSVENLAQLPDSFVTSTIASKTSLSSKPPAKSAFYTYRAEGATGGCFGPGRPDVFVLAVFFLFFLWH